MENKAYTQEEIIETLIAKLTNHSQQEFAFRLGVTPSTISKIASGEKTLTTYYADKIVATFPTVNRDWLLTGRGYPGDLSIELVRQKYESLLTDKDRLIETMRKEIEILQEMIQRMK